MAIAAWGRLARKGRVCPRPPELGSAGATRVASGFRRERPGMVRGDWIGADRESEPPHAGLRNTAPFPRGDPPWSRPRVVLCRDFVHK